MDHSNWEAAVYPKKIGLVFSFYIFSGLGNHKYYNNNQTTKKYFLFLDIKMVMAKETAIPVKDKREI